MINITNMSSHFMGMLGIAAFMTPFTALASEHAVATTYLADVGYAVYAGRRSTEFPNSVAFLGVPYAEPPLGNLRFRAPHALNTSRVTKEADGKAIGVIEYPDFCVQGATNDNDRGGAGSEDCLKVNIYAPENARRTSKLPVLVYIHGGAYVYGNPRNWPFDHWIQQSPNVVIVSVYYRLSAFGFLSHPAFNTNPKETGDLNAGFQDQTMALRWVQANIAAFGGDPSRVTINGESAGGGSVELHLVADEGSKKPLFVQAIAQSVYRTPVPTPLNQVLLFDAFAAAAGCGGGSVDTIMACLRKASLSSLAMAQDTATRSMPSGFYDSFHPVVDGKIITDHPTRLVLAGKFLAVPLIVGATSNETLTGGLKDYFPGLNQQELDEIAAQYKLGDQNEFSSPAEQSRALSGEPSVRCGRSILAGAYAQRGLKTFAFRYNQANPTSGSTIVEHAAENWMMFLGSNTGANGTATFTPLSSSEQAFASEVIAYWLSFVRAGNPNTFRLTSSAMWTRYATASPQSRNRIVLQHATSQNGTKGSFMEPEPVGETRRCAFVAGVKGTQA